MKEPTHFLHMSTYVLIHQELSFPCHLLYQGIHFDSGEMKLMLLFTPSNTH